MPTDRSVRTKAAVARPWIFWLLVATALLAPIGIAPVLAPLFGWRLDSTITRSMMVFGAIAILLRIDGSFFAGLRSGVAWRRMALAFGTTVACCVGYSAVLIGAEAEALRPELFRPDRLLTAIFTGLVVSAIEEPVFRRYLPQRLAFGGTVGTVVGIGLASALYSLVHYIRPAKVAVQESYAIADALGVYANMLHNLAAPIGAPAPGLGLFALGVLLCVVARRFGLGASIGIHAALVYYLKVDATFVFWNHADHHFWFGTDSYLYDGVMFLCVCAGFTLFVKFTWRPEGAPS